MQLAPGSLRRFDFDSDEFDGDNQHVYILADTYNMQFKWMDSATDKPYPGLSMLICDPWEFEDFLAACPPPINKPRSCGARVKRWILK